MLLSKQLLKVKSVMTKALFSTKPTQERPVHIIGFPFAGG